MMYADTMMKFASFETIVELIYKHAVPVPKSECSKTTQLGISFAGGYIAGVFCAVVSHPADNLVSFLNNAKGATVGDVSIYSCFCIKTYIIFFFLLAIVYILLYSCRLLRSLVSGVFSLEDFLFVSSWLVPLLVLSGEFTMLSKWWLDCEYLYYFRNNHCNIQILSRDHRLMHCFVSVSAQQREVLPLPQQWRLSQQQRLNRKPLPDFSVFSEIIFWWRMELLSVTRELSPRIFFLLNGKFVCHPFDERNSLNRWNRSFLPWEKFMLDA